MPEEMAGVVRRGAIRKVDGLVGCVDGSGFVALVEVVRPRLSRAFVAAYGPERGEEALAEALGYAWQHFDELAAMDNPAGFLYRVGQSRSRPRRNPPTFPSPVSMDCRTSNRGWSTASTR